MITAARTSVCAAIVFAMCDAACGTDVQSTNDWYRPEPPSAPSKNTPIILPPTTARPVFPVPVKTLERAMSKLARATIVSLAPAEWEGLKMPFGPRELLARLIDQKEKAGRAMNIPGLGELRYNASPVDKEEASNWNRSKEHLRPYLVRAVAADGDDSEFFADVWNDVLTVTHHSMIDTGNDPLKQHAAILLNPSGVRSIKSPVIVYLEAEPKAVYTNIQIVKAGL